MSNELAVTTAVHHEDKLTTVQRLGKMLAASGYFSDVSDLAQAAVKVMAGEELGIAPVASMMGLHIIKGKVTLSANLIAALVRRHGYNYRHTRFDATGCELEFLGKSGEVLGLSSFTEADAKAAGVFSDMYKKFPRNMYFARCISNGAKWYCPEVMSGLPVYVPEELGANVDGDGEIIQVGSAAAAKAVGERKLAVMSAQSIEKIFAEPVEFDATDDDIPMEMGGKWEAPIVEPAPEAVIHGKPWKSFKGFLDIMADLRKFLGDDAYYGVLMNHGLGHANDANKPEIALKVYAELKRVEAAIRNEDEAK